MIDLQRSFHFTSHILRTTLFKNAFYLMANQGVGAVLGFLFWFLATRFYTPEEVGLGSAMVASLMLITVMSGLGYEFSLVRFLPYESNRQRILGTCLITSLILSLVFASVYLAGISLWSPSLTFIVGSKALTLTFLIFSVALGLMHMQRGIFHAYRSTRYDLIQDVSMQALKVLLVGPLVFLGTYGIYASAGISALVAVVIGLVLVIRYMDRPAFALDVGWLRRRVMYSASNYLSWMVGAVLPQLMPLMVINVLGADMAGYFTISWVLSSALLMIISSVSASLFIEGCHEPEKLHFNTLRSFIIILCLVLPIVLLFFVLADKVLLLFGEAYSQNATRLLRFLLVGVLFGTPTSVCLSIMRVLVMLKSMVAISLMDTCLVLTLSYVMVLQLGLVGIGVGYTISQLLVAATASLVVYGRYRRRKLSQ